MSSIPAFNDNEPALNEWPDETGDEFADAVAIDASVEDLLSIDFMQGARIPRERPRTDIPFHTLGLAIVACMIFWGGLGYWLLGGAQERCAATSSSDTCFTALNR